MYLEISAPGTGKTTRLVKEVCNFLKSTPKEYKVTIVTLLKPNVMIGYFPKGIDKNRIIITEKTIPNQSIVFWDEFDKLPQVYINDSYYSTSIAFPRTKELIQAWIQGKRKDMLLALIAANQNKVTSFESYKKAGVERYPPAHLLKLGAKPALCKSTYYSGYTTHTQTKLI